MAPPDRELTSRVHGAARNVIEPPDRGNAATMGKDGKKKRVRKEVTMDPTDQ